jgi:hypothetical protein
MSMDDFRRNGPTSQIVRRISDLEKNMRDLMRRPVYAGGNGTVLSGNKIYCVRTAPATVTTSIASPCVVGWSAHGLSVGDAVVFNTTGALPTGLTAGTVYYVISAGYGANSFEISTSIGGGAVNTSGTQSGTQTAQTGNDSNDGASAAYGHALLTIQKAVNLVSTLDTSTYSIIIQLADGYYTPSAVVTLLNLSGSGQVTIQGNNTTPANCIVDGGFSKQTPGTTYSIKDMLLQKVFGSATTAITSSYSAVLIWDNINFGSGFTYHLLAAQGGVLNNSTAIGSSYTVSGSATYHVFAQRGSIGLYKNTTLSGTPAFTKFVYSTVLSAILSAGVVYTGSATGTRYTADFNSIIQTYGGGASYFPGNAAGGTATGGQYN